MRIKVVKRRLIGIKNGVMVKFVILIVVNWCKIIIDCVVFYHIH